MPFGVRFFSRRSLTLRYAVVSAMARVSAQYIRPECRMLGTAPSHALAPHFERAALHFFAHQCNHSRLVQPKLHFNRLKRRAVFPRHFNNARDIRLSQKVLWRDTFHGV